MPKCLYITPTIEDGMQIVRYGRSPGRLDYTLELGMPQGKNEALLKACRRLTVHRFDYVVILDDDVDGVRGDIEAHLVGRLHSGRRVFTHYFDMPSRIRMVWQDFATVFLRSVHAPWGGCMAIRRDLLPRAREVWARSIFDGVPLRGAGYRSAEIPIDCLDHSAITWRELWRFVVRQYVDVRFGYGGWLLWLSWAALIVVPMVLASYSWVLFLCAYMLISLVLSQGGLLDALGAHLLHLAAVPAAYLSRSFAWKGMRFRSTGGSET